MEILVCLKRVPLVGGKIALSEDGLSVDTRFLGFTMSPHEECVVEEAVRLAEKLGGSTTVLTVGPPEAEEQLRYALSLGIDRGVLVETGEVELGPQAVADEIVKAVRELEASGTVIDLLLFGNESADSGNFQVGILVAETLHLPCVIGVKEIAIEATTLSATREDGAARELFSVALPAVCAVKEGLNLPRYPSLPGRLRAKSKPLTRRQATSHPEALLRTVLRLPKDDRRQALVLGQGAAAAPRVVEVLAELGVLPR